MAHPKGVQQAHENKSLRCQTADAGSIESQGFSGELSNPLDRPLTLTKWPKVNQPGKQEITSSLRSLAPKLARVKASAKTELPLLKLATFGDRRKPGGRSLRHNGNVLAIDGVEGDYDGERMSLDDAARRLRKAGVAALIYTSASHQPDAPRWRVFCPTSRSLPPARREKLMARLNGVFGGKLDGGSFDLSRSYFYGRLRGGAEPEVELVEGRAIDLLDTLDSRALDRDGEPFGRHEAANDEDDNNAFGPEPDVERIREALDAIPAERWDNDYGEWLRIGQALHNEFGGSDEGRALWNEASQWCETYDSVELDAKWDSFGSHSGKSVSIGTLFYVAKQCGWRAEPEPEGRLRFISTEECQLAPPRGYVIKGLIAPGDVACIFGPPGAGKSLIAPYLGFQVALGESAFGMRTKPGGVLYVAAEDAHGLQNRIAALATRQGHASRFHVVDGVSDLFSEDSADLAALADAVEDRRPALLFIDTLAMGFPGLEENDAKSMGRVVAACRRLAEHGAAVVLIHHDTKAEGSTPRGHSVLNGALDMALHIKRDDDGIVRGKLTKNRNGTAERDIAFTIGVETLDEDEDGDPITAALAKELTGISAVRPPKLPPSQREALTVLEELEADGSVSNAEWAEACANGLRVSQSENVKLRRDAFNRARRALATAGLVVFGPNEKVRSAHPEVTSEFGDE